MAYGADMVDNGAMGSEGTAKMTEWLEHLWATPVAARLTRFEVAKGTELFREGEPGDFFLVVVEGEADVQRHGNHITTVGAGSVLGELALLTGDMRSTTVITRTPLVSFRGNGHDFMDLLEYDPVREHFTHLAASRLAENVEPVPFAGRNGFNGELRPLLPTDRQAYIELLGKLSPASRRKRFFSAAQPSERLIEYLLNIDFVDHFAWVVLDTSTTPHSGCGIARFIRNSENPHSAEVAFSVIDAMQGQGLGTIMLGALAVAADAAGITTFTAEVLDDNMPMRKVFQKASPTWSRPEPGVVKAVFSVADAEATLDPELHRALTNSTHGIGVTAATALRL